MSAIDDIAAERARQISEEGWSPQHDDEHSHGEMAMAAACYAAGRPIRCEQIRPCGCRSVGECPHQAFGPTEWRSAWPWDKRWWKPKDRRRDLIRAGALIVAEIERLDRRAIAAAIARGAE